MSARQIMDFAIKKWIIVKSVCLLGLVTMSGNLRTQDMWSSWQDSTQPPTLSDVAFGTYDSFGERAHAFVNALQKYEIESLLRLWLDPGYRQEMMITIDGGISFPDPSVPINIPKTFLFPDIGANADRTDRISDDPRDIENLRDSLEPHDVTRTEVTNVADNSGGTGSAGASASPSAGSEKGDELGNDIGG